MNLQKNKNNEETPSYNITFVSKQMKKLNHARFIMAGGSMTCAILGFASLFGGNSMMPFTYGLSLASLIALFEYYFDDLE